MLPLILLLLPGPATPVLCWEERFCAGLSSCHLCSVTHNTPTSLTPHSIVADSLCGDTWLFPAILEVTPETELLPCPALVEPGSTDPAAGQLRGHSMHLQCQSRCAGYIHPLKLTAWWKTQVHRAQKRWNGVREGEGKETLLTAHASDIFKTVLDAFWYSLRVCLTTTTYQFQVPSLEPPTGGGWKETKKKGILLFSSLTYVDQHFIWAKL